jgi:glycosyltransferase involved in cell wall biosynthesis
MRRGLPVPNDPERPLVSVLVFNYNYGKYLSECFESVLSQTYANIEICFSDNASTDDSWDIAIEYSRKYPGVMNINRNRMNFGVSANWLNCDMNNRGKYYISLCSDDMLLPEYVEKCVKIFEAYHNLGFVMVHRKILDGDGNCIDEPPFYNTSCLIPGIEQAAVYMMAAVNPSVTQIMYRKLSTYGQTPPGDKMGAQFYSTRMLDFNICCHFPIAYLKEPLMVHRLHNANDSFRAADHLMEVIGPYVLQFQFAEKATHQGLKKVAERLPSSIEKLSRLCLRYAIRGLEEKDERKAKKYFHLAAALMPEIETESVYFSLQSYWHANADEKARILAKLKVTDNLVTRTVSYDPPDGSVPIGLY